MRDQPASAVMGIKVLIGLIPGIAMFVGALILTLYPLRGQRLEEMQQKVLALHAEKRERLAGQRS
jgi:Na+/melibiose symporter-like transporter